MGFQFNIENFGIGLLTGWASAYGIYRARNYLQSVRKTVSDQAVSARMSATRSADSRYINEFILFCETQHLAAHAVNLSEIVVEPRFIPAPELAAPPEDDVSHDVFYVVPKIADLPSLHAPYNIDTISIDELSRGERTLALLGLPGSGRTTALLTIGLWGLGKVRFDPPRDSVQDMLDQEESLLSEEDRATRLKERLFIEERARERLAEEKGDEFDPEEEVNRSRVSPFMNMMPVYVHLANLGLRPGEFGRDVDPAEPLVRAVQHSLKRITAKVMPRDLYKRLNQKRVLLLVDGFDELPEEEQKQKLAWLNAFIAQYRGNFVIVAGPAQGYGRLLNTGLTPVFMRPWGGLESTRAADNWASAWPTITGNKRRKDGKRPAERLINQAKTANHALSPADITLKIWQTYGAGDEDGSPEQRMRAYLERYLNWDDDTTDQIIEAARLQLDRGFITALQLESALMGVNGPDTNAAAANVAFASDEDNEDQLFDDDAIDEDDLDALFDEQESPATSEHAVNQKDARAARKPQTAEAKKEAARISKEVAKLLATLVKTRLLVAYKGGRYQFRHPFIAAYLASLSLKSAGDDRLVQVAFKPAWTQALAYAATHTPIDAAVQARLNAPADMLQNNILEVSRWLAYTGTKAHWRSSLLKQLGNLLIAPNQYSFVRERVAAALVTTRDRSVLKIFHVAAENENADLRRLACLGMGAIGDPESIPRLARLLEDTANEVQLAAGLGLGAIGSEEALEAMVNALTTGSEQLRQAISETFAAIPDEGYPILYDAINHEDMMLRRAAVFGLRRVRTGWSLVAIYRAFLEDKQWYVRSAAQQAFLDMQHDDNKSPKAYPPVDSIPWLRDWVMELGEAAPQDQSPEELLTKAMAEGDTLTRALSATTLGQLGFAHLSGALYDALGDQESGVRDIAHRALADLQMQIGESLPLPV